MLQVTRLRELPLFRVLYVLGIFMLALSYRSFVFADSDVDREISERRARVKEFCDNNPGNPRCGKFLDSKYRRHSDVDREELKEKRDRFLEQHNDDSGLAELRSMCRKFPDSPRCDKLRSKKNNL